MSTATPTVNELRPRIDHFNRSFSRKTVLPRPRQREAEAMRQQVRQAQPTQDITPPVPTITPKSRLTRGPRGRGRGKPAAMRQPRTAATPMVKK